MSERLPLPEHLTGDWEHALIFTYGADLGFYESALWRHLARVRNKIVLADHRQLLRSWDDAAAGWRLRYVNRRYVVEGVQLPRAMHAKAILLANGDEGRLLIGSGNLSNQGYAGGGEVFAEYAYDLESVDSVEAFGAVLGLADALRTRGWIGPVAARHLLLMTDEVPWLARAAAAAGTTGPVRHNLTQPLAEQFRDAIDGRRVEMLWLAAPFLDRDAAALRWLLTNLRPQKAALLIQEELTSAQPTALEAILKRFPALELVPYTAASENPYVHAKFYLAQLANRAVCLHGSPNLSAPALLRTAPAGNLELANLGEGARSAFQDLLTPLRRRRAVRAARDLKLATVESDPEPAWLTSGWRLVSGEWHNDHLRLRSIGPFPGAVMAGNPDGLALVVGADAYAVRLAGVADNVLDLELSLEAQAALGQDPAPVRVRIGVDGGDTNAVYVAVRRTLEQELQSGDIQSAVEAIRDTELGDQNLEALLLELDRSLVWTPGSLWKVAGQTAPRATDWDDDGVEISYSDVDEVALRSHPRVQQYLRSYQAGRVDQPTRLQVLLRSILGHFDDLKGAAIAGTWRKPAAAPQAASDPLASAADGETAEAVADVAAEEAEWLQAREDSHRSSLIKRFLSKYLKGHESAAFRNLVGFEVVVQNAILFNHLLVRLFLKEWVDHVAVVDAWLKLWIGLFGSVDQVGWVSTASDEDRIWWQGLLHTHHTAGECVAMTFFVDRFLNDPLFLEYASPIKEDRKDWERLTPLLRDQWRAWLARGEIEVSVADWEDAWLIVGSALDLDLPRPSHIAATCVRLIQRESHADFETHLVKIFGERIHGFDFDQPRINYGGQSIIVQRLLVARADLLETPETAEAVLREWMRGESHHHYRVAWVQEGREQIVVDYDARDGDGFWFDKATRREHHYRRIAPSVWPWDEPLRGWTLAAAQVDAAWAVPQTLRVDIDSSRKAA